MHLPLTAALHAILRSLSVPGIKSTLPPPTTYSVCLLPALVPTHTTQDHCHLCCLPLLTLHTILLALIGSDLATLASWLPGSKLKRSLFGGSPTVAQCLLLQTCKLPKTARIAQKCAGKAYSAQTGRPSVTLHMREPSPLFPYKVNSSQASYSPVKLVFIPPHLQRKSVMLQVDRVPAFLNRVILCHMPDILILHIYGLL